MWGRPPNASLFFFNDTATTEIYTLSLHDALPISGHSTRGAPRVAAAMDDASDAMIIRFILSRDEPDGRLGGTGQDLRLRPAGSGERRPVVAVPAHRRGEFPWLGGAATDRSQPGRSGAPLPVAPLAPHGLRADGPEPGPSRLL